MPVDRAEEGSAPNPMEVYGIASEVEAKPQIVFYSWSAFGSVLIFGFPSGLRTLTTQSCHSCAHCAAPTSQQGGWCRLRHLPVHAELARLVWCHHWTAQRPSLPELDPGKAHLPNVDRQLDLGASIEGEAFLVSSTGILR